MSSPQALQASNVVSWCLQAPPAWLMTAMAKLPPAQQQQVQEPTGVPGMSLELMFGDQEMPEDML